MKIKPQLAAALTIGLAAGIVCAQTQSGPLPGKIHVVKSQKIAKLVAKSKAIAPDVFALPVPGSGEDPTIVGARLLFTDVGGDAGSVAIDLHRTGWTGLGNPPGSKGYKYKAKNDLVVPDPKLGCSVVLIKDNVIKAVCKNTSVQLTPPYAGAAAAKLEIPSGSPAIEYCWEFGGETKKNDAKLLKRKDAPAPPNCSGAVPPAATPTPSLGFANWYLGVSGDDCDTTCARVGHVYDPATESYAGSGGTLSQCGAVLDHLGFTSGGGIYPLEDRFCPANLGCIVQTGGIVARVRCTNDPTTSTASDDGAARACACQPGSAPTPTATPVYTCGDLGGLTCGGSCPVGLTCAPRGGGCLSATPCFGDSDCEGVVGYPVCGGVGADPIFPLGFCGFEANCQSDDDCPGSDDSCFDATYCGCAQPMPTPSGNLVFVTQASYSTTSAGGIPFYDAECQRLASAAGLSGSWVAWVSGPGQDAANRVTGDGPFLRVDGVVVAGDRDDLLDGTLDAPISTDEDGNQVLVSCSGSMVTCDNAADCSFVAGPVMTGTESDGLGGPPTDFHYCSPTGNGWDQPADYTQGWMCQTDAGWTNGVKARFCTEFGGEAKLYCFQN